MDNQRLWVMLAQEGGVAPKGLMYAWVTVAIRLNVHHLVAKVL